MSRVDPRGRGSGQSFLGWEAALSLGLASSIAPSCQAGGGEAPGPQAGEQEGRQDGLCGGSGSRCLVEAGGLSVTGAWRQRGTGLCAPCARPVLTTPREPRGHLSRLGSYSTSSRCCYTWDLVSASHQA